MYRMMLYFLAVLVVASVLLSLFGVLSFSPGAIVYQAIYLLAVCYGANFAFAKLFKISPNSESSLITALILTLIVGPVAIFSDIIFLTAVGVAAMASKYLLKFDKRHIFNPAAFGVVFSALVLNESASWWLGGVYLVPLVVLGGILIAQKTGRWHLILSFLAVYIGGFAILLMTDIASFLIQLKDLLTLSPILFFSFVMLVEPLTAPSSQKLRILYGAFIAVALIIFHGFFPTIPYSLELSLLLGNAAARIVSPRGRINLLFSRRDKIGADTYELWFEPDKKFDFIPGQYMEVTFPHSKPDSRGVRRFFTIASSPTEKRILIATRISEKSSSFKRALKSVSSGAGISLSSISGGFVLPKDVSEPLIFIAGGIGITPFRSMVQYLLDKNEKRDIVLLYSNRTENDIVFRDTFQAGASVGVKTVYTLTDETSENWQGRTGLIDDEFIKHEVPDFARRTFYISGPAGMVRSFEAMVTKMGIPRGQIKHDYFPGYD